MRTRKKIGPGDAAIGKPTTNPSTSALAIAVPHNARDCIRRDHRTEGAAPDGAAPLKNAD